MRRSTWARALAIATLAGALGIGGAARAAETAPLPGPTRLSTNVSIRWVDVGHPGNRPDTEVMAADRTTGYGAVPYDFKVAKFLVTNAEYAAFLNAVARDGDPYLLWFPCM